MTRRPSSARRRAPARPSQKKTPAVPPAPRFSDPSISHPKKRAFLAAYGNVGNVSAAAGAANIDRRTHSNWLQDDADYAAAFLHAKEHAADYLETVARSRAVHGSDTLIIFLLKGLRPEKYRERFEHTGAGGGPIQTEVEFKSAKAALTKKLAMLGVRAAAQKGGDES